MFSFAAREETYRGEGEGRVRQREEEGTTNVAFGCAVFFSGSARKVRFGKVVTGKTRGTERFLASHVRRLPASEETTLRDDRRTSGNGGGSVHLVSALALSAATGLLRAFTATRRRRDARDSWNAPAPGATRDAKDSAPMRGIGFGVRGETSKRQNASASRNSRGASRKAESGPERADGRDTRRGARVRSAARSAAAGDNCEARDRARGNAIFSKKTALFVFQQGDSALFPDWRFTRLSSPKAISAAFLRALRFSFPPVVELVGTRTLTSFAAQWQPA